MPWLEPRYRRRVIESLRGGEDFLQGLRRRSRREPEAELVGRHRPGEDVALRRIAAHGREHLGHGLFLDALRDRLETEGARRSYRENCESMHRVHISPVMGSRHLDSITTEDIVIEFDD